MKSRYLTLYSDITSVPVKWIWKPYIAIGKITLLQGDPGCGKSTMMMHLISELSNGSVTTNGNFNSLPQRVLYQCSEDGTKDTIKPRLESAGADCQNIAFIDEEVYDGLTLDDERLLAAITEWKPRLVVIDPIQSYIENETDLQMAGKARKLMRKIGMWASTYDFAVVLIGHFSKNEGVKALYRGLGSIDVVATARSVLQIEKSEEDQDIRIVKQVKNSLEAQGEDLMFEINPQTGFHWIVSPSNSHKNEIYLTTTEAIPSSKHELAAVLLKEVLNNGPMESVKIRQIMTENNIGVNTMNRVKAELGIKPYRKMKAWYWALPGNDRRISSKGE